jgi:oxygen-independent coproporphyrinogen-3 oxidase
MRPKTYQDKVAAMGLGLVEKEALSRTAWAEEYLMMGLRIEEGVSLLRFKDISGCELSTKILYDLSNAGLVLQEDDRLSVTSEGQLLLNSITEELLVS